MISIITGDIINSQKTGPAKWLGVLKKALSDRGDNPRQWEIYRGDSFQLEIKNTTEALAVAIIIKSCLKSIKGIDVRIAIGIGEKKYNAKKITESNGSAFVYSGRLMEELKSLKRNMAIRTKNPTFDKEINLYIKLALIVMDSWSSNSAKTIYTALQHPDKSQKALGKLLRIKQNAVSTRLKRAHYQEIMELLEMYRNKIDKLK